MWSVNAFTFLVSFLLGEVGDVRGGAVLSLCSATPPRAVMGWVYLVFPAPFDPAPAVPPVSSSDAPGGGDGGGGPRRVGGGGGGPLVGAMLPHGPTLGVYVQYCTVQHDRAAKETVTSPQQWCPARVLASGAAVRRRATRNACVEPTC